MWISLWIRTWILVIYANFQLFIECLLLSIWLMRSVFSYSFFLFFLFVLCLWWRVSGFIPAPAIRGRFRSSGFLWSEALICAASLSIIYSGFDSSGWCCCSDTQVFLISSIRGEFTTHLNLSIRRGALFPLLRFQLTGTDEPRTESSAPLDLEFVRALERNPR